MKFYQALFFIYLIGIEAKPKRQGAKLSSKAGKTRHPDGFRSLLDDGLRGGRSQLSDVQSSVQSSVNHGNIAHGISKYGHFGLNVESNPGDGINSFSGATADLGAAEHAISSGANPMEYQIKPFDGGSKAKRPSDHDVGTKSLIDGRSQVATKSQGSQSGAQFGVNERYSSSGQPSSYYGSEPGQSGLNAATSGLSSVQTQSSSFGQSGSYPYYGTAPDQGSQFGQGLAGLGQPAGYPGFTSSSGLGGDLGGSFLQGRDQGQGGVGQTDAYPGFGIGLSQGQGGQFATPYGQSHIQAPYSTFGAPASYSGTGLGQVGQVGAQFWQSGLQYANGGQPASYYGSGPDTSIMSQNWPLGASLQGGGLYTGVGQPPNYYGTVAGNNVQGQGGFLSWLEKLGALGGLVLSKGALGIASNAADYQQPVIHSLSRYLTPGFYYPPPQHLNLNPNMWDPAARYFFTLEGQELPNDKWSPPTSPQTSSNAFPVTYAQL